MLINYSKYSAEQIVFANADLKEAIKKKLIKPPLHELESAEHRSTVVHIITEGFYDYFAEYPDTVVLYYLANYMMADFIKEGKSNKGKQENSFKTPRQLKTLATKEKTMEEELLSVMQSKRNHNRTVKKFTGNFDE